MPQPIALITGTSRGIGKAIALRLAEDGFCVVLNYNRSKMSALRAASFLRDRGHKYFLIKADISNEKEVVKMMKTIRQKYGCIDALVNNAGIIDSQPFADLKIERFDKIHDTNVRGSILVTKHALPLMRKSNNAKIVFILSSSAFVGSNSQFSYVVSKAGLIGVVRALALEFASAKILVNGVVPGYVDTDMARKVKSALRKGIQKIPLGRIADPKEIAELASFLVSEKNTYITGQCIHINGGRIFQ